MSARIFWRLFFVLAAVDTLIPYLLLQDLARFSGVFLFWTLLCLAVIAFAAVYTRRWVKKP